MLRIESEVGEGLVDAHITSAGNGSSERGVVELDVESTVFLTLHGHHLPANIGELPRGCLGLVTRAGAASACVRLHQAPPHMHTWLAQVIAWLLTVLPFGFVQG